MSRFWKVSWINISFYIFYLNNCIIYFLLILCAVETGLAWGPYDRPTAPDPVSLLGTWVGNDAPRSMIGIDKTSDRHHTKIPRKKLPQFDFQPRPARGRRDRCLADFKRRLRLDHASASQFGTCPGLCIKSGSWDMLKLKRKAKNKIDQNLLFRATQYLL